MPGMQTEPHLMPGPGSPDQPAPPPDVVPTHAPAERPLEPGAPDILPGGSPGEMPMPGLPPEIGPASTPAELRT
jgi:hypothetical protein